jgi:hypothetical protein
MQYAINPRQFGWAFHIKAEMGEAGRAIGERGRKVERRLIHPPTGVTRSAAARRCVEQFGIERNRVRQAFDHDMHMKPLHAITFFCLDVRAGRHTAGAQVSGAPLQQFSVR